jgi:DNA-binding CsgD family transcriptional regulator/tetratricopeptide (TPR) repeat protein
MTHTAQPLVGRDHELHALDRLLQEVCAGSPRLVVLSGEPGIGKTSLIAELARRAQRAGCLVLQGRATELERDFPFGLFVDAFDAHLAALDDRSLDRLGPDELGELAAVFPALRSLRPATGPVGTAAERFRAHHAARELMERLAARRPLLLTLDDVHWSDGASLELIGHLLRRIPDAAVMVAVALRTGQAPPALSSAIEDAGRTGQIERFMLGPLEPGDAERLLAGSARTELPALYRESGGNPFYLLQLARAARRPQEGPAGSEWTDDGEVPPAISAAISAELDGLAAPVRAFAQASAVAGDPFELDVALATTALAEADALAALDELIARDVLRVGELPRRFRFRHPLVRKAIYVTTAPGTRLVAHERAAAELEARGAPPVARAHHVAQSARHGDAAAVALLREAGLEAAQRAPSSAALWFQAALRIVPASTPAEERGSLHVALGGAHAATGRFEDSRAAFVAALELTRPDDPLGRARLTSACASIELLLGRGEAARARLMAALDELPQPASRAGARLMMDLAASAFYATDDEGMREWARRALGAARPREDRSLIAGALGVLALAEAATGPVADAVAHCAEAAALIDAMPDEELAHGLDGLAHLCGAEYCLDRFAEAAAHARRGLALGRATGRGDLFPVMSQALAGIMFSTGRLAEAAELIDGVVDAARLGDNAVALAWGLLNRGYTSLTAGDVERALGEAGEAVALTREMEGGVVAAWAGAVLAAGLVEAGRPEGAAELLLRAGGGAGLPRIPGAFRANFLEVLTRAWLAAARPAEARQAADAARARAEAFGLDFATAVAERAVAAVALDAGDAGAAARRALGSAERADAVGARVEAGVSRTLAGRALAQAGDREGAVAVLERAASALDACGARRHRAAAERELRRLGRGAHRRSRPGRPQDSGPASLTGRELEIARLVVDRRTNPEIAAELFLSIKTVETHLRNIFRKLDAGSRVEVARIVERSETVSGSP